MVEIYTDVSLAKGRGVATCFVMSSTSYIGYNMFEYTALNSSLQGELLGIRDGIKYVASLNTANEPVTLYCDNKAAISLINSKLAGKSINKFERIVTDIVKAQGKMCVEYKLIQGHQSSHNPNKIVDLMSNSVLRENLKKKGSE